MREKEEYKNQSLIKDEKLKEFKLIIDEKNAEIKNLEIGI
jgi:hypothetical protein